MLIKNDRMLKRLGRTERSLPAAESTVKGATFLNVSFIFFSGIDILEAAMSLYSNQYCTYWHGQYI